MAKGASDMILTDDNFCSIVRAIEKGRIIYAGIQKFVSFIMSVHFAEVLQIFLCIVSKIPVMRQPLQILFLILVTDLPPSIALGFEPGEPMTMKRKPRPKTQPVVLNWMWRGIVANGMILTVCIFCTYLLALYAYAGAFLTDDITSDTRTSCAIWPKDEWKPTLKIDCGLWTACSSASDSAIYDANCAAYSRPRTRLSSRRRSRRSPPREKPQAPVYTAHGNPDCEICIETSIRRASTSAFISLVWAENFRAYCSRSFERPVWEGHVQQPLHEQGDPHGADFALRRAVPPRLEPGRARPVRVRDSRFRVGHRLHRRLVAASSAASCTSSSPGSTSRRRSSPGTRRTRTAPRRARRMSW